MVFCISRTSRSIGRSEMGALRRQTDRARPRESFASVGALDIRPVKEAANSSIPKPTRSIGKYGLPRGLPIFCLWYISSRIIRAARKFPTHTTYRWPNYPHGWAIGGFRTLRLIYVCDIKEDLSNFAQSGYFAGTPQHIHTQAHKRTYIRAHHKVPTFREES